MADDSRYLERNRCEPIRALRLRKFFRRIEMVLSCESNFWKPKTFERRHVTLESFLSKVFFQVTFVIKLSSLTWA